ncbi:MAG: hypothetical protein OXE92_05140 [Bacteroidetes bacterium]|nr:hypothetical protein [Bacteroidota bacterium]MCY4205093.1 hypothetical protein [Bacteroidota bacterium]
MPLPEQLAGFPAPPVRVSFRQEYGFSGFRRDSVGPVNAYSHPPVADLRTSLA